MAHTASHDARWQARRGREAARPGEIPAPGWKDILLRLKEKMSRDRLSIIAAGVAFYGLLALFPALIALVAIYGLAFDTQQVERHAASFAAVLPEQAADLVLAQLHGLVQTGSGALGIGAIVGLLVALWSASTGIRTLMEALNVAYEEEETRGFVRFYGAALLLTLAAILGAILAIGTVLAVPIVMGFLGLGSLLEGLISFARWPILALAMMAGLAVMYRFGPSRRRPKWRWVSWGAVVATALWIAGSALFSLYVSNFGTYNETYGSVGAVVILLTWFLLTAYAVLVGAELNAEMERQTRRDTTEGRAAPLGARRAHAADTVGDSR